MFCRDKYVFVATKMILVAAPANDSFPSVHEKLGNWDWLWCNRLWQGCRRGSVGCRCFRCITILVITFLTIIIIMYVYHALIYALSAHMIHINLNTLFYTHVEHSPIKTIYIRIWTHTHARTRTHTHAHTVAETGY